MSTGKRLAKRSILGTRVCAPRTDRGGLYLCGVIQASRNDAGTREENVYRVYFDEDGKTGEYPGSVLIGPGFKNVPDVALRPGQTVFVTHNGREVRGKVLNHVNNEGQTDNVDLTLPGQGGSGSIQLKKRLEDVRLIESRKSARLQDSDTDYSRLAEGDYSSKVPPPEQQPRRRASSLTIDVPYSTHHSGGRKRRSSADDDGVMDDCMAAMVLMSLSCSPKSSSGPHSVASLYRVWGPTAGSSGISSGASSYSSSSGGSSGSTRATPSPPSHLLVVATDASPLGSGVQGSNNAPDEGIEVDDSDLDTSSTATFDVTFPTSSAKRKSPLRTRVVFQCTWKGCGKQYQLCHEVEKHVRTKHLGLSADDDLGSGGEEEEDHEEEFYYTEIEIEEGGSHHHSLLLPSPNGDNSGWEPPLMAMPSSIYSSSVPTLSHLDMARPAHEDPEYRKQQMQVLSPDFVSTAAPISIPQLQKPSSTAWHLHGYAASAPSNMGSPQKCMRLSPKPSLSSPNKSSLSPLHHSSSGSRRTRSESRKCRKVYGMENRDMWCTQCKWKKACTRFVD